MSATMALGLGQNLKRVWCVLHMGRGDPSAIVEMRPLGKNKIEDFEEGPQDEDDWMDALAVTPVCLRIALTVDNQIGHIPLSEADPHFQMERAREVAFGFPTCKCSNCKTEAANNILNIVQQMSNENFDQMLSAPLTVRKDDSIVTIVRKKKSQKQKSTCHLHGSASLNLDNFLVQCFYGFYMSIFESSPEFPASDLFGINNAQELVESLDEISGNGTHDIRHLEKVIGGEFFPGNVLSLSNGITNWYLGNYFQTVLDEQSAHEAFIIAEEKQIREEIQFAAEDV
ncbi:hypothetical protein PCANC_16289 [Puccinia coronata f. sp. avenae]|uniref:Uncharacterized protein n=1 Tax=Puccinia coronata f. sp. avenae TaxID=200324 RepID=A0A2N5UH43_9BASI|nr:hypothetical protein PCANC_16289 [Puccinia coronata f. sp. avenae]